MSPKVLIDKSHSPILIISINRPQKFNCVDFETAHALEAAFIEFEEDDEFKVAILTGIGGNFCSGADLAAVQSVGLEGSQANPMHSDLELIGPMGVSRLALSKPVIAAINGYCLAGGVEVAAWTDLRVVAKNAKIAIKCRIRGVPLIDAGSIRLPRLIGFSRANDLILTGREIGGEEAYQMGFANRLVDEDRVMEESLKLASLLASHPQTCMRNDRDSAYSALYSDSAYSDLNSQSTDSALNSESETKEERKKGNYNVTGGLKKAMEYEFRLGLESLKSPELQERLVEFLSKGKAGKSKL